MRATGMVVLLLESVPTGATAELPERRAIGIAKLLLESAGDGFPTELPEIWATDSGCPLEKSRQAGRAAEPAERRGTTCIGGGGT